jgi:hypothetical protein
MTNKARLMQGCGREALNLLRDGCERVVILWDERPAWPDEHRLLCYHHDLVQIREQLRQVNLHEAPVFLVCIEREFESWLLFDHILLSALLSRETRPVRISRLRNPDRMKNPKGVMMSIFERHGKRYVDVQYARRIADNLDSLTRLKKCRSFRRFGLKVTGVEIK